jgi:hypothetical protein
VAINVLSAASMKAAPSSEQRRVVSHADARAVLTRVGADPARIDEILSDYPDPIDLAVAEPALCAKFGITEGALTDRMGGSP